MTGNAAWMKATDPVAPVASSGIQGYAGIPYVGYFPPSYPDAPYPGRPWTPIPPIPTTVVTTPSVERFLTRTIKNPKPKVSTKRTQEVLEFGEIQEDWITTVEIGGVTLKFDKDGAFEEFVETLGNHLTVIQQATAPR